MEGKNKTITLRDWHGREVMVRPEILSNGREIFIGLHGAETAACRMCGAIYNGWSGRERMCRPRVREQYN